MKRILFYEKIRKAPPFLTIKHYLRPQDKPGASHPETREPRIVPLVIFDYGSVCSRLKQMRYKGLNVLCRFRTIMAVRCALNIALLAMSVMTN
jgi:hypothetical protein